MWDKLKMTYRQIVVVDFSEMREEEFQKKALCEAKTLLAGCGEYKNAETARVRETARRRERVAK